MDMVEEVNKLVARREKPTLEEIAALAREAGIKDVAAFWTYFDSIMAAWSERKSSI